jgi:hypothetical protein
LQSLSIPRDHGTPTYAATSYAVTPANHSGDTAANYNLPVETPRGRKGHEGLHRTVRRVVSDRKTIYLTPLSSSHVLSPRPSTGPGAEGHYCVDNSPGGILPEMPTTGFQRLGHASSHDTRKAFLTDSRQEPTEYSIDSRLLPQTEDIRKPEDKGPRSQQRLIADVLLESDYKMIQSMHESGVCNLLSPEEEERIVSSRSAMQRRGPAAQAENNRVPHNHGIHLVVHCEAKPNPFNNKCPGAASNEVSNNDYGLDFPSQCVAHFLHCSVSQNQQGGEASLDVCFRTFEYLKVRALGWSIVPVC